MRVCVCNLAGASLPEPKRRRRDTGQSGAADVLAARRRSRPGHGRTSVANFSFYSTDRHHCVLWQQFPRLRTATALANHPLHFLLRCSCDVVPHLLGTSNVVHRLVRRHDDREHCLACHSWFYVTYFVHYSCVYTVYVVINCSCVLCIYLTNTCIVLVQLPAGAFCTPIIARLTNQPIKIVLCHRYKQLNDLVSIRRNVIIAFIVDASRFVVYSFKTNASFDAVMSIQFGCVEANLPYRPLNCLFFASGWICIIFKLIVVNKSQATFRYSNFVPEHLMLCRQVSFIVKSIPYVSLLSLVLSD